MIVYCEPQCYGFEHAEVNASLLQAAAIAFPEEKMVLMAEPGHLASVRDSIDAGLRDRIEFVNLMIAPRRGANIKRFVKEFGPYQKVLSYAKEKNANKLMFLSITSPGLIWLKWFLHFHKNVRAVAVLHGMLETIDDWSAVIQYELFFWLRFTLLIGNRDRIKYLLLGAFIKKNLDQRHPSLSPFTRSMDLPYRFFDVPSREPFEGKVIRFGALGVGSRSKGTDVYFELPAKLALKRTSFKPDFFLVGPVTDLSLSVPASIKVLSPHGRPLTMQEYHEGSMLIDYAVFCHRPSNYRYTMSAAFFDALAYGKPVIALRNPMFEYYFDLLGEIGYLCNSDGEMIDLISKILSSPSTEEYKKQQSRILDGRRKLGIAHSADQIKEIWKK